MRVATPAEIGERLKAQRVALVLCEACQGRHLLRELEVDQETGHVRCPRTERLAPPKVLSQRALAKAAGLSHGGVQRIETGKVDTSVGSLGKLCRSLGLVVAEVVTAPVRRES